MTGLNLEAFLRLLQADAAFWMGSGTIAVLLGLGIWAARGRTPIVSRCLALSLAAHVGLVVYGGPQAVRWLVPGGKADSAARERRREAPPMAVALLREGPSSSDPADEKRSAAEETAALDRPDPATPLDTVPLPIVAAPEPERLEPDRAAPAAAAEPLTVEPPEPSPPPPTAAPAEREALAAAPRSEETAPLDRVELAPVEVADAPGPSAGPALPDLEPSAVAAAGVLGTRRNRPRVEPIRGPEPGPLAGLGPSPGGRVTEDSGLVQEPLVPPGVAESANPGAGATLAASPEPALPEPDSAVSARRGGGGTGTTAVALLPKRSSLSERVPLLRENPLAAGPPPSLAGLGASPGARPLPDIPEVYRSRMAPNRSALALAGGASAASEEAVERALAWLARHQDADGRWNAGARRGSGGAPVRGETSFTAHCPRDEVCEGESYYWEADTAMTGLALLAFLGAGQTHESGPHADTVARGLAFLIRTQKLDGDLRGASVNVGMYCHAIASLALCEAYALTSDRTLRGPVERALEFLVASRTVDKVAWRYQPNDRFGGDTSILGWAVMVMKSAREVGIAVPEDARQGALKWLKNVAEGPARGLALYRPGEGYPVTPTMTAEAWACRQFLGVGGPGAASDEAAAYLLQHGPDRDPLNLYYWYYATLALYQHGGDSWVRWNNRVRDQLVRRQSRGGHADGSWDPALCKDKHDMLGGRLYTTAVATLTLEVYYRYLRLYDAPATPASGRVERAPGADAALRRVGVNPDDVPDPQPEPASR